MPVQHEKHHFAVLDGLRGIAACAVLIGHTTAAIGRHCLVEHKGLAVQFFFMLSGFVIAYAYEARLMAGMSIREFCLRRAIRLYPLIVAGAVLGTCRFATGNHHFSSDHLMFIPAILGALALPSPHTWYSFGRFPINPPEWSLFWELLAYIAFGVLIPQCKCRHLMIFCAGALVLYTIWTLVWFGQSDQPPFLSNLFGAAFSFSMGILLWRGLERGILPRFTVPFWILALILLTACCLPLSLGWAVEIICVALVFPSVIVCGAAHRKGSAGKIERLLGGLSYPLYILHWPIMLLAVHIFLNRIGPTGTTCAACGMAVLTAWIALVCYDQPVRQWLGERLLTNPAPSQNS